VPSRFLIYAMFEVQAENEDHAVQLTDDMLMARVPLPEKEFLPESCYIGIDMLSITELAEGVTYIDGFGDDEMCCEE
jgi:hypothetical protein